jgi:hypothetical protein
MDFYPAHPADFVDPTYPVFLCNFSAWGNLDEGKVALTDKELDYLEKHIPELAEVAFKQAYWAALASGSSVLISENGNLVEVFPDGERKIIKPLPPSTPVTKGQKMELR